MAQTLSARRPMLAVFCGGLLGTLVRYFLSTAISGWLGTGWPYDILLINLTGALLLALITTLADATSLIGPTRRLLINTGFMGAYTTFSSLALGDVLLFSKGQFVPALLYLMLSLLGGICAVLSGNWLGQQLTAICRRGAGIPALAPQPAKHPGVQNKIQPSTHVEEFESRIQ